MVGAAAAGWRLCGAGTARRDRRHDGLHTSSPISDLPPAPALVSASAVCLAPVPCLQEDWLADLNPESLVVVKGAYATPELAKAQPGERCVRGQASHAGGCCNGCWGSLLTCRWRGGSFAGCSASCSAFPCLPCPLTCPAPPALPCPALSRFQLERLGYFCVDPDTASSGSLVLNRTCTLKESSSKQTAAKGGRK